MTRYLIVDVFTDRPLQGNQLGVFPDAIGISSERMQLLARELGFSESVFVLPAERGGDARLRIFTPSCELPFAGHPVLGCAFALAEAGGEDALRLETGAGTIPVALRRERGRIAFGWMSQPIPPSHPYPHERELLEAIGVGRSGLPVEAYENGPLHVLVELESIEAVGALRPDLGALAGLGEIAVSCFARGSEHWKTRVFAPGLGVHEDPATGSAAGPLAVHLARHGRTSFGQPIEIDQGRELGRPSVLHARAEGTPDRIERVEVGGSAVIVAEGEFRPA